VDSGITHAVLVGAGFIGLELAENMLRRGIGTTVVELQDQVLPPLDREMTTPVAESLRGRGVELLLGESAEAFRPSPNGLEVVLKSGESIATQLVVLGVGVRPENQLAVAAGLAVGPRGGIQVDDRMRTSDPSIYAVGDAVEVKVDAGDATLDGLSVPTRSRQPAPHREMDLMATVNGTSSGCTRSGPST
jgi:NADPH-dependent 2,4-dienoyl-CoA reductase/sulfur reductase-like enzyme